MIKQGQGKGWGCERGGRANEENVGGKMKAKEEERVKEGGVMEA